MEKKDITAAKAEADAKKPEPVAVTQQAEGEEAPEPVEPSKPEEPKGVWQLVTSSTLNTEYIIEGLTEGHAYRFRVCARNLIGVSAYTEIDEPVERPLNQR